MKFKTLFLSLFVFSAALSQSPFSEFLQNTKGLTYTKKERLGFKEYYEVFIEQPLDHFNPGDKTFRQLLYIGINNINAPVIFETQGYAANDIYASEEIRNANVISAEHRFFGKSRPDTMDWKFLTVKQSAYDCHYIKEVFAEIFKSKWMTLGISKGGHTALAYKMFFPNEVAATVVYGTPVKKDLYDSRINKFLEKKVVTATGKKVFSFQQFVFKNKQSLFMEFTKYAIEKKLTFSNMSAEELFDRVVLEYPFSFFQNGHTAVSIPGTISYDSKAVIDHLCTVVPLRFYADKLKPVTQPAFHMFYQELGYYNYAVDSFAQYLSQKSYPNAIFAPFGLQTNFDPQYLKSVRKYLSIPSYQNIIFIYGENDPYSSCPPEFEKNDSMIKLVVKGGSHKSRIKDLDAAQKQKVFKLLSKWLQYGVGN